jgi:hypothetical protein
MKYSKRVASRASATNELKAQTTDEERALTTYDLSFPEALEGNGI